VRSVFIVLSDDLFRQVVSKLNKFKKRDNAGESSDPTKASEPSEATGSNAVEVSPSGPFKTILNRSKGSKRGASSQGGPSAKK